jgi:hypothetical protein
MSSNPVNLAVRFILEIVILIALGRWGWEKHDGWLRYVLAFALPLFAAALWGIFRIPNDPKEAPIAINGVLRLILELSLFASAIIALYDLPAIKWSYVMALVVIIHYALSYNRILWMIKQ